MVLPDDPAISPDDTTPAESSPAATDRRAFLRQLAIAGLSSAALAEAARVAAQTPPAGPPPIPDQVLKDGAMLAGLDFTQPERDMMAQGVADTRASIIAMRAVTIENGVQPAFHFMPLAAGVENIGRPRSEIMGPFQERTAAAPMPGANVRGAAATNGSRDAVRPSNPTDLAFLPAHDLSRLVHSGKVTSRELTELYLDRIRRFNPQLLAVITPTDDLAFRQADRADEELRAGRSRGPLHGLPYGVKDLFATRGIPTTWGAEPYRGQIPRDDATVVRRLEEAGAVLIAKTAVGALAWGDVWFGGTTKNPWKLDQGSSGSSAGSASGTAAGLYAFSIGTETLGSIVSPSTRCGTTGLRPTFGRVPRTGAMALSWTMDKAGPICRSVDDCSMVFDAIHGADGQDMAVHDAPFASVAGESGTFDWSKVRLGYDKAAFDEARDDKAIDDGVLDTLRRLGARPVVTTLPDLPVNDMLLLLTCEAAAAFDELTRTNQDEQLTRQIAQAWPNIFRESRLIPSVDYIQANRIRTLLMRAFDRAIADVDVYVTPSFYGGTLRATNLTGHPTVVLPDGFRADGTPNSISFTGRLYGEEMLLRVARAYQDATEWHLRRPGGFA